VLVFLASVRDVRMQRKAFIKQEVRTIDR
jgi:hypothetical protein